MKLPSVVIKVSEAAENDSDCSISDIARNFSVLYRGYFCKDFFNSGACILMVLLLVIIYEVMR